MAFFLRSLSDRCQLVTGTYKTNVSKFARKVFNYFQSFSSFTPLTGTTNFSDDILTMVEMKWSSARSWPNNYSSPAFKIAELAAIFRKSQCLVEGSYSRHHLFARNLSPPCLSIFHKSVPANIIFPIIQRGARSCKMAAEEITQLPLAALKLPYFGDLDAF